VGWCLVLGLVKKREHGTVARARGLWIRVGPLRGRVTSSRVSCGVTGCEALSVDEACWLFLVVSYGPGLSGGVLAQVVGACRCMLLLGVVSPFFLSRSTGVIGGRLDV